MCDTVLRNALKHVTFFCYATTHGADCYLEYNILFFFINLKAVVRFFFSLSFFSSKCFNLNNLDACCSASSHPAPIVWPLLCIWNFVPQNQFDWSYRHRITSEKKNVLIFVLRFYSKKKNFKARSFIFVRQLQFYLEVWWRIPIKEKLF